VLLNTTVLKNYNIFKIRKINLMRLLKHKNFLILTETWNISKSKHIKVIQRCIYKIRTKLEKN
jgi:hypothetical protein